MSADKHTPGPWYFSDDTGIEPMSESGPVFSLNRPHAELMANACLIAVAPDLLEFAQEVRRSGDTRLASMAIAVINRATGGQT